MYEYTAIRRNIGYYGGGGGVYILDAKIFHPRRLGNERQILHSCKILRPNYISASLELLHVLHESSTVILSIYRRQIVAVGTANEMT